MTTSKSRLTTCPLPNIPPQGMASRNLNQQGFYIQDSAYSSPCDPPPPFPFREPPERARAGGRMSPREARSRPSNGHEPSSSASNWNPGPQSSRTAVPESPRRSTGRAHRARFNQDVNEDDHDEDEKGQDDRKNSRRQETRHPGQSFACPFAKADPVTHRSCLRYTLKRIGDVKAHIQRNHMAPVQCPRCGLVFDGRKKHDDRRKHIEAQACDLVHFKPLLGLSLQQIAALKSSNEANRTGSKYERRWYSLWDSLFPGELQPATAYAGSEFQERMDLAAAHVSSDSQIHQFANGFPVDQHERIHGFFNILVQRFRSYAARQEDARVTSMSPSQDFPPYSAQPSWQPATATGYSFCPEGQADDWIEEEQWDFEQGQNCGLVGDYGHTVASSSRLPATWSLGPIGNNGTNDNDNSRHGYDSVVGVDYPPSPRHH